MKVEWNGNILHSVAEMKSRKLRGKKRTEFGKRLVHETPSKICRQNLVTLSSEAYSSGSRGPSMQVLRNVKHQLSIGNDEFDLIRRIIMLKKNSLENTKH